MAEDGEQQTEMNRVETEPTKTASVAGGNISGVGALLRASRTRCNQSLRDISQTLRIRQAHLEAIEEGRFHDLPGATYASGFIRAYAEHLGLDSEEVVRRFRQEAAGLAGRSELVFPSPVREGRVPTGAVLLIAILLGGLAYGSWYALSMRDRPTAELVPEVPARLAKLPEAPAPVVTETQPASEAQPSEETKPAEPAVTEVKKEEPAKAEPVKAGPPKAELPKPSMAAMEPPKPALAPEPAKPVVQQSEPAKPVVQQSEPAKPVVQQSEPAKPVAAEDADKTKGKVYGQTDGPVRIVLTATHDVWIQVTAKDSKEVVSQRILKKGDMYRVPVRPNLLLATGNTGAMDIQVDGQSAPKFGKMGDVRREISLDPDKVKAGTAVPPKPETPKTETPKTETPKTEAPKTEPAKPAAEGAGQAPASQTPSGTTGGAQ